jgi:hypothetical protein
MTEHPVGSPNRRQAQGSSRGDEPSASYGASQLRSPTIHSPSSPRSATPYPRLPHRSPGPRRNIRRPRRGLNNPGGLGNVGCVPQAAIARRRVTRGSPYAPGGVVGVRTATAGLARRDDGRVQQPMAHVLAVTLCSTRAPAHGGASASPPAMMSAMGPGAATMSARGPGCKGNRVTFLSDHTDD